MSENSSPVEQTTEPVGALSALPSPTSTPAPGLWSRLSKTQKLCAIVSGSVVTLVGGIAGYTKLTAKPTPTTIVANKPDDKEPAKPEEKDPPFVDVPPAPKVFKRDADDLTLPPVPPVIRTKQPDDIPLLPVSDRPKIKDDFTAPKLPDIPDVPLVVPPKELPADLKSKNDGKDVPILRPARAEETAPPPKKVADPLGLDLPAVPPTPPAKDVPLINIPPKPMGMMMDPPLLLPPTPPTPPTPMGMGMTGMKKDDLLLMPPAPPTPPMPMGMKNDDLLLAPPPPPVPMDMGMGMKKDDLLLAPPPPPMPMGMGMKMDDLIAPPLPPSPLNMGVGMPPTPPTLPKKDDLLAPPPFPPLPMDMVPKKVEPGMIVIPMPPSKIDFPMIDPMPMRKDPVPIPFPMDSGTPKRDSYEEDWHAPKPSDTFATISREYYKTADYSVALEAYNKNYTKNNDRIIRVPPTWVLREKFPDLVKDTSIDPKLPERIEKPPVAPMPRPELKFDPVEPPIIGGGVSGTRPAPPPAVEPVKSRTDEYRVTSAAGESIKEIARKVLGNADQWKRLYELNPSIDPTEPIPTGTILRLSK